MRQSGPCRRRCSRNTAQTENSKPQGMQTNRSRQLPASDVSPQHNSVATTPGKRCSGLIHAAWASGVVLARAVRLVAVDRRTPWFILPTVGRRPRHLDRVRQRTHLGYLCGNLILGSRAAEADVLCDDALGLPI